MSLFVPVNGTMQSALVDLEDFGTREYELWIDTDGDDDLEEVTAYLKSNDLSIDAPAGIVATTARATLRNSQQTFAEGDFAGRICEIRAGIAGQTAVAIFTGWVSKEGCQRSMGSLTDDTITISMHDRVKRSATGRKMTPAFYVGYKILDTTSPSTSLFHLLAAEMGLEAADLDIVTINHTKDAIGYDGKATAWKEIQALAEAYLADRSCYFRYDGKLRLISRYQSGWSQASEWTIDTDSVGNLCRVKAAGLIPVSCTRARTTFDDYEALASQVIYRNTEGWITSVEKCDIDVLTGAYWPGPNAADKARLEYALPDTGEAIPLGTSIETPTTGDDGDGDDIESDNGVLVLAAFNGIKNLIDLNDVSNDDTVTVNTITYTKKASTTVSSREFANAVGLVSCINDVTYGVENVTAAATGNTVVCTASSGTVSLSRTGGILISKTRQNADSSEIILYNGEVGTVTIRKLEITGVPNRVIAEREVEDIDADVAEEDHVDRTIDGRYMVSDDQAHATTGWWVEWGGSARKYFEIDTYWLPQVQKGAVVSITLPGGAAVECYVEAYKHRAPGGPMTRAITELVLVAIESYSSSGNADVTVVSPAGLAQKAAVEAIQLDIVERPTYTDVDDGYVNPVGLKGTTTPTQVTIVKCKGMLRSVMLQWDRQYYLTNLVHYEIQVSDDDETWYSLQMDGTDWKDTLAAVTTWHSEIFVHPAIPLDGDADDPSGPTLYYRVRRVTRAAVNGDWSASSSTTVLTVEDGDLGKDIIYANNIIASEITALLVKVKELWVGYDGLGTYASPVAGDRRIYVDGDEITFQEYLDSVAGWSTLNQIKIGGTDANGNFLPFLQCGGIIHGDYDGNVSSELLPYSEYLLWDFEDTLDDHLGNAPASAMPNPAYTAGMINTKCVYSTDTGGDDTTVFLSAADDSVWTPGEDQSFGIWFKAESMSITLDLVVLESIGAASEDRITLQVYGSGEPRLLIERDGVLKQTVLAGVNVDDEEWHYLGVSLDVSAGIPYLSVDGSVHLAVADTSGVWKNFAVTSQALSLSFHSSDIPEQTWCDEFVVVLGQFVDPHIWALHYNHGVPWNTDASVRDIVFKPMAGGKVRPIYGLPVPFMGFPHMLDPDDRTDGYDITDASVSDTWEEGNLSALLPPEYLHSIRWARCRVQLVSTNTADSAIICARHKGSAATVEQSYLIRIAAEVGASAAGIGTGQIVDIPVRDGIFEFRRYSASHPIGGAYFQLWGYYV